MGRKGGARAGQASLLTKQISQSVLNNAREQAYDFRVLEERKLQEENQLRPRVDFSRYFTLFNRRERDENQPYITWAAAARRGSSSLEPLEADRDKYLRLIRQQKVKGEMMHEANKFYEQLFSRKHEILGSTELYSLAILCLQRIVPLLDPEDHSSLMNMFEILPAERWGDFYFLCAKECILNDQNIRCFQIFGQSTLYFSAVNTDEGVRACIDALVESRNQVSSIPDDWEALLDETAKIADVDSRNYLTSVNFLGSKVTLKSLELIASNCINVKHLSFIHVDMRLHETEEMEQETNHHIQFVHKFFTIILTSFQHLECLEIVLCPWLTATHILQILPFIRPLLSKKSIPSNRETSEEGGDNGKADAKSESDSRRHALRVIRIGGVMFALKENIIDVQSQEEIKQWNTIIDFFCKHFDIDIILQ